MHDTWVTPERTGPSRRTRVALALLMTLLHLAVLLSVTHTLDWRLPPAVSTAALQTRMIAPPSPPVVRPATPAPAKAAPHHTTPSTEAAATPPEASASEPTATPLVAEATASEPFNEPSKEVANSMTNAVPAASAPVETPAPVSAAATPASWPTMALGALPPSSVMSYQLTGMDKGFTYDASGQLRWQHNLEAYALTLSVKAFLVGGRHWRSTGRIDASGLSPIKFTDSWRGERASHFDREQQRIVFSSNAPVAPLQPGAQDQISLYMQLAAAMAGAPERYPLGSRLQVQTATTRDAAPWLLVLEGQEALSLAGHTITTSKWVCQPRGRYDAKIEMWLSPRHAWMPARIRITQVSGSYIDLNLRSMEPLPPLPANAPPGEKTTSP